MFLSFYLNNQGIKIAYLYIILFYPTAKNLFEPNEINQNLQTVKIDPAFCNSSLDISDDFLTLTASDRSKYVWRTCLLTRQLKTGVHTWTVRIDKTVNQSLFSTSLTFLTFGFLKDSTLQYHGRNLPTTPKADGIPWWP